LKLAGAENCPLCGLAHFGHARLCPHINSETQVRQMLDALRSSGEDRQLVDAAKKYLTGVKGHLVLKKKLTRERLENEQRDKIAQLARERAGPTGTVSQRPGSDGMFTGVGGAHGYGPGNVSTSSSSSSHQFQRGGQRIDFGPPASTAADGQQHRNAQNGNGARSPAPASVEQRLMAALGTG